MTEMGMLISVLCVVAVFFAGLLGYAHGGRS